MRRLFVRTAVRWTHPKRASGNPDHAVFGAESRRDRAQESGQGDHEQVRDARISTHNPAAYIESQTPESFSLGSGGRSEAVPITGYNCLRTLLQPAKNLPRGARLDPQRPLIPITDQTTLPVAALGRAFCPTPSRLRNWEHFGRAFPSPWRANLTRSTLLAARAVAHFGRCFPHGRSFRSGISRHLPSFRTQPTARSYQSEWSGLLSAPHSLWIHRWTWSIATTGH